jgi:hypothetical protein
VGTFTSLDGGILRIIESPYGLLAFFVVRAVSIFRRVPVT